LERHGTRDRRHRIQFFTIAETAEMLRVCTHTVRRWVAAGELIAYRFGNAVRIAEPDLRAFLALHREG
jgi:excisionase family DNA binding protein